MKMFMHFSAARKPGEAQAFRWARKRRNRPKVRESRSNGSNCGSSEERPYSLTIFALLPFLMSSGSAFRVSTIRLASSQTRP